MAVNDQLKEEALDVYLKRGTKAAADHAGVTVRTIARWAADAGMSGPNDEKAMLGHQEAARITQVWGDYREREAMAAGAAAAHLRNQIIEASDDRDAPLLRARAISYGVLIDKAELLSGKATSRVEVWAQTELDAELRRLVEQLETQ